MDHKTITGASHKTNRMIEPNELMLANYIFVEFKVSEVIEIDGTIFKIRNDEFKNLGAHFGRSECDPITLSAAVLEACGFKWDNIFDCRAFTYSKDTISLYCIDPAEGFGLSATFNYNKRTTDRSYHQTEITTLHQLQNLCFLLTGQPLEIDMDKLKNEIQ